MCCIYNLGGYRVNAGLAAATKHALGARRWLQLNDEVKTHEKLLDELTSQLAPKLVAAFGVGAGTHAADSAWRKGPSG